MKAGYERIDLGSFTKLVGKTDFHKILEGEIGPRFKEYREKWDESAKGKTVQDFPLQLDLGLNGDCNLRCPGCPQSLSDADEIKLRFVNAKDRISFKTAKRLIDEGARNGLYSLNLNGVSEPLLSPILPAVIEYARGCGLVDVFFSTNAALLSPKKCFEILEAQPTRVFFSVDNLRKETYERYRRGADFDSVMGNIERFLALKENGGHKLPVTRVSFIVRDDNHAELPFLIDYWKDKVDYLAIQTFQNPFIGTKYEKRCKIKPVFGKGERVAPICNSPFQRLVVNSSGSVFPCCSWCGFQLKVGDIYKESLCGVWRGRKMVELREKVNTPGRSKLCGLCLSSMPGG